MKGVVKTLILLVVFVLSVGVGYMLPIQEFVGGSTQYQVTVVEQPKLIETYTTDKQESIQADTLMSETDVKPELPEPKAHLEVQSVSVYGPRKNNDTDKLSYNCSVKALYPEGSRVRYYAYYYQDGVEKSVASSESMFRGLSPVDSGVYEFTIKDLTTGDESPRFAQRGFNKVSRMSRVKLENILNNRAPLTKDFYNYIVANVKINTQSIFQEEGYENVAPTCCDHIFSGVKYSSWVVEVVGEPQYNNDNRITEFTIVVTKK